MDALLGLIHYNFEGSAGKLRYEQIKQNCIAKCKKIINTGCKIIILSFGVIFANNFTAINYFV